MLSRIFIVRHSSVLIILLSLSFSVCSHDSTVVADDAIATRFLDVLLRRPQPGTALDRVFEHHVQQQTIDDLLQQLDVAADQELADQELADQELAGRKQFVRGLILLRQVKLAKAIKALSRAEQWLPKDPLVSYHLGIAHRQNGEVSHAIEALRRSVSCQPARRDAAEIYLELGRLLTRNGDTDGSSAVWGELEQRFAGDQRVTEKIAQMMIAEANLDGALARYASLAQAAKSPDAKVRYQIAAADLRARLGQNDRAVRELTELLARSRPGSWLHQDLLRRIESQLVGVGGDERLVEFYEQQKTLMASDPSLTVRMSQALARLGKKADSEKALEDALKRFPTDNSLRLTLAELLVRHGNASEAAAQYQSMIDQSPDQPDLAIRLGEIHLSDATIDLSKRRERAADCWDKLAELRQDDPVILVQIAGRMNSISETDRALKLYQRAVAVDSESTQYHDLLGQFLYRQGRHQEAIVAWRQMAMGDRRNRDSLLRLASILKSFGRNGLAMDTWDEAAEMDLTFDQTLRYADQLSEVGRHNEAIDQVFAAEELLDDSLADETLQHRNLYVRQSEIIVSAGKISLWIDKLSIQPRSKRSVILLSLLLQASNQSQDAEETLNALRAELPDDVDLLWFNAELAEQQGRYQKAAVTFQRLAKLDPRGQANYLIRSVNLLVKAQDTEAAMASLLHLIDVNPAAVEQYRQYARLAKETGELDEAQRMLRRGLAIAPGDGNLRLELAACLAEDYQTAEAIELIWDAIESEQEIDKRLTWIASLVPLYNRRGEIDLLISRITKLQVDRDDPAAQAMALAEIYQGLNTPSESIHALESALAMQPLNTELLERLVKLCEKEAQLPNAIEYQNRLVSIQNTDEARLRLLKFRIAAGEVSEAEALKIEFSTTTDPRRLGEIVHGVLAYDVDTAIELCQQANDDNDELWDLKLIEAQMRLFRCFKAKEEPGGRIKQLIAQVLERKQLYSLQSPCGGSPSSSKNGGLRTFAPTPFIGYGKDTSNQLLLAKRQTPLVVPAYPTLQAFLYALRKLRLDFGADDLTFNVSLAVQWPSSGEQAYWVAFTWDILLRSEALAQRSQQSQLAKTVEQEIEGYRNGMSDDLDTLKRCRDGLRLAAVLVGGMEGIPEDIYWKIAELDPRDENRDLQNRLAERAQVMNILLKAAVDQSNPNRPSALAPLSTDRLRILTEFCSNHASRPSSWRSGNGTLFGGDLRECMINEHKYATTSLIGSLSNDGASGLASIAVLLERMRLGAAAGEISEAGELLELLMQAARNPQDVSVPLSRPIPWILSPKTSEEIAFVKQHQVALIDVWIAYASKYKRWKKQFVRTSAPEASVSAGWAQTVVHPTEPTRLANAKYRLFKIPVPISRRLLYEPLMTNFVRLLTINSAPTSASSKGNLKKSILALPILTSVLDHLSESDPELSEADQQVRRVTAAYACWWAGEPKRGEHLMRAAIDQAPDDLDLQVELCRILADQGAASQAMKQLGEVAPANPIDELIVDMTLISIATENDRMLIAHRTAESVMDMTLAPLDQSVVKLFLAKQGLLRNIGWNKSTLQGQITFPRAVSSTGTHIGRGWMGKPRLLGPLERARTLLKNGDRLRAAEAAFVALERCQAIGRAATSPDRLAAIEILRQSGHLGPSISATKRELALAIKLESPSQAIPNRRVSTSAPNSDLLTMDLAELQYAAGNPKEAIETLQSFINRRHLSPIQVSTLGKRWQRFRTKTLSRQLFMFAIRAQPSLWNILWPDLCSIAGLPDEMAVVHQQLATVDLSVCSLPSLCVFIGLNPDKPFSAEKVKFVRHLLKTHGSSTRYLDRLFDAIPERERASLPELEAIAIDAICDPNNYRSDSKLWTMDGCSAEGIVNGSLDEILAVLVVDGQASQRFRQAAPSNRLSRDSVSKATGDLLVDLLDWMKLETRPDAAKRIALAFPATFVIPPINREPSPVPSSLLWQAGQMIRSTAGDDEQIELAIGLFEAAATNLPRHVSGEPLVGNLGACPLDQLFDSYHDAGRNDLARRGWLSRWHTAWKRTKSVSSKQQMSVLVRVSERLLEIGCPIDTLLFSYAVDREKTLWRFFDNRSLHAGVRPTLTDLRRRAREQMSQANAARAFQDLCDDVEHAESTGLVLRLTHGLDWKEDRIPRRFTFSNWCELAGQTETGKQATIDFRSRLTDSTDEPLSGLDPEIKLQMLGQLPTE